MVGPEVERTALVRHCTRLFNVGANMTAPLFTVIVRKAYGLGAQAMCGAGTLVGFFCVAWPTAEFAGMNIEGAVKLGYRKELMAIEDPEAHRKAAGDQVAVLQQRQGGQCRGRRRNRRRDRPRGHARLDRQRPEARAADAGADDKEVPVYRSVVSDA
jgi:acetyl-CoA carboxylase carboxyltransferase component